MKKVSIFAFSLLFVTSMLVASAAFANGSKKTTPSAPIDGGITLLLAAGVGLGVKKVLDRRKHA